MTSSGHPFDGETRLRLRLQFGAEAMLGPGKVDLLQHIDQTGSIAAAGRAMKMSYKRAWLLVEEMNAAFREPLVETSRGGTQGGGAHLTPAGHEVFRLYRAMETVAGSAAASQIAALQAMLGDISKRK